MNDQIELSDIIRGYTYRDGFVFTSLTYPLNYYDAIVVRNPEDCDCLTPKKGISSNTLEEHIKKINSECLEKAIIIAEDIKFITRCPSLKYIRLIPATTAKNDFDFSPLYDMPCIKMLDCRRNCGEKGNLTGKVDYLKIKGLEYLFVDGKDGDLSFNKVKSLKSINVSHFSENNLMAMFCSKHIDTVHMVQCGVKSLDGIEQSERIQCLYLHYNRLLYDINALDRVKSTLRALRIENCPKIQDFSVLGNLENLELLELSGSNDLPDLHFLKTMKSLKTFIFDMNVLDGDLIPCQNILYVHSKKDRKHYNIKDKDLPKGVFVRGNENIEVWRRME